ncbi:MAG: hypothetical protein AAGD23_07425, partial [Pseudomonadota bacterium]
LRERVRKSRQKVLMASAISTFFYTQLSCPAAACCKNASREDKLAFLRQLIRRLHCRIFGCALPCLG